MRVLVTGVTGLVGGHVARRLSEEGWAVRVLVRRPEQGAALAARGMDVLVDDLTTGARLQEACRGIEVIFHCAGHVPPSRLEALYAAVNVEGTRRLLRTALAVGVRRVVCTSSVAVYGGATGVPTTEEFPLKPRSPYGQSKLQAEHLCREAATRGLEVVVLRPCFIYGPSDRHFLPAVARILRLPVVPLIGGGGYLCDIVHAADVAEAHLLAASSPSAPGAAYNVTDGQRRTVREVLELVGRGLGRRVRILPVPWSVAAGAGAVVYPVLRLLRSRAASAVSPRGLRGIAQDAHFPIDRARRDLGYAPRAVSPKDVVAAVQEWRRGQEGTARG